MNKLITIACITLLSCASWVKSATAAWDYATLEAISNGMDVFWESFLGELGVSYPYPTVYIHNGVEDTPCGPSELAHYCLETHTIHLNMVEMNNLAFNVGDSAAYFVLAHEYSHSVQRQLGLFNQEIPTVVLELQADCLAGILFSGMDQVGIMEKGDLEEGMFTALMFGDYAYWEDSHHGTPEERMAVFTSGFTNPATCFDF